MYDALAFQLRERFLIKTARLTAVLLVALAPAAAMAEMSYNRIEVSLVDADYDDTDVDGDGIELAASYLINDQIFIHGRWVEEDLDFDVDGSFFELGVGLRKAIQDDLDFVGTLSYIDIEIGSGDDDGLALAGGVRAQLSDNVQAEAMVRYINYDDLDSDTGIVLTGRYYFNETMAISVGLDFGDLADNLRVGFRLEF